MLFQRKPLPPDVEYFLDCANEADEINSFDHAVLTLLGDRKTVMAIVDTDRTDRPSWRGRVAICLRLDAYAHQIVAELPPHEQKAFLAIGLRWEPLHLLRIAEYLVHFNFEDETRGGANLPFRRHWRCDRNYDPTPGARRRLYAPAAIRRFTKLENQSIPLSKTLAAGLRKLPPALPGDQDLVTDLLREQREAYRAEYHAARSRFEGEQRRRWGVEDHPFDRRMVRRAAQFCAGLVGADQVSAFARGQPVALQGKELLLEVARQRSVATMGHGALDVRLCAPDGTRLASVCVYFDKTPALDQLAALAMHIGSGDERAVIETGNLFNITKAGETHPLVQARIAQKAPANQDVLDRLLRHGLTQSSHDLRMAALRRYQADTIQIYIQAVRTRVWGRDACRLHPFIDNLMEPAMGDIRELGEAA